MDKQKNDRYRLLLLNAKAGDNKSLEALFLEFKPLVTQIARGYFLNDREQEDLIQEGMIGLYKAFLNYDISTDSSFYAFAKVCISRQIVSAVRSSLNKKNAPLSYYISIDESDESDEDGEVGLEFPSDDLTPEEIFELREQKMELIKNIKSALSKLEFDVLKLYLAGKSYKEISILLDKNEKSIDNCLVRIKQKLKSLEM